MLSLKYSLYLIYEHDKKQNVVKEFELRVVQTTPVMYNCTMYNSLRLNQLDNCLVKLIYESVCSSPILPSPLSTEVLAGPGVDLADSERLV